MRTLIILCMSAMAVVAIPQAGRPYRAKVVKNVAKKAPSVDSLSSHMLDLLPEFASAINGLTAKDGLSRPAEMIATFFPIIRKAMEAQAVSKGRTMSKKEEGDLKLTEKIITLSVGVMNELMATPITKDAGKAINSLMKISRPIMEENAKREGRPLTTKEKTFLYYFESGYKFTIEALEAFAKDFTPGNMIEASGKVAEYIMAARAKSEGRELSWEEKDIVKDYKKQLIEVIQITNGFGGSLKSTDELIDNFIRLMRFVLTSNAKAELPKRWALTWEEEKLLKTTKASLKQTDNLLRGLNSGSISKKELDIFGKNTRTLWEERAAVEGRELTKDEAEYLRFTERVTGLAKLLYHAW